MTPQDIRTLRQIGHDLAQNRLLEVSALRRAGRRILALTDGAVVKIDYQPGQPRELLPSREHKIQIVPKGVADFDRGDL